MEIKCYFEDCLHSWNYKGKSNHYVTCPRCLRKLSLKKIEKEKESQPQGKHQLEGFVERE